MYFAVYNRSIVLFYTYLFEIFKNNCSLSYLNMEDMRDMPVRQTAKEENAIVLDFLPNGYPDSDIPLFRRTPIAQAIGSEHFNLLELIPKKGMFLQPLEKVYIGEGKRDKIHHIGGRMKYEKLTQTAKSQLELVLRDLVKLNEPRFIEFFNRASGLTIRMHQLELLPGMGKKNMQKILEERDNKLFESFADIHDRAKIDAEKVVIKRILEELEGNQKHYLFVGA